jgi:hypothetical protein
MSDWSDLVQWHKQTKPRPPYTHKYRGHSLTFVCGRRKGKGTVHSNEVNCPSCLKRSTYAKNEK